GCSGCERERDVQNHIGPGPFQWRPGRQAEWTDPANGAHRSVTMPEKVRNVSLAKLNEFRISSGSNETNSFIELYNSGAHSIDISNWTLTLRPTQQAIFSTIKIPAGTRLASHAHYLLGLSNSGLAVPAHAGDATIYLRSTNGMSAGDT